MDYDLVQRDPKISPELKEIVRVKDLKGQKVLDDGRRDNLITDRTYEINRKQLERWVSASYDKIADNQRQRSGRKTRVPSNDELMRAALDG